MKSLRNSSTAGTFFVRHLIMILTVFSVSFGLPSKSQAIWPFNNKDIAVRVQQNRKGTSFSISQAKYAALVFFEDAQTHEISILGKTAFRPPIDTKMQKILSVGIPAGLTVGKENNSISTYEVKGDENSQLFVINTEKGTILVNRIKNDMYHQDHVLLFGKMPPVVAVKTSIQDAGNSEKKISLKLSFASQKDLAFEYQSEFKQSLELISLPSTQGALDELRQAQRESIELKENLKNIVFGQDPVLERLTQHILETKTNGMSKPKVLLAMGPSGVGKSYSAQALADLIYKDPKHFFEISGNEYNAGTHSLDYMKLLGAAKGTKGGDQDGALVQWLKENEGHGVMIINEGDKMHADVWKKLMEFLEKGKISDNEGKAVWGRNVVVLITSNRGATRMFPASVANWSQADIDRRLRELSQDELRGYYLQKEGNNDNNQLPREILNRIDEFIPYGPLSKEAAVQIANAISQSMIHQYQLKYGLDFQADKKLIEYIALTGFKASDDARQIGNQVKKMFTLLMREGLDGLQLKSNDVIHLTLSENSRHEKVIVATANNHSITVDAPKEIQTNAFKDTAKMERLQKLESTLKSIVLGQDEAMTEIAHSVLAYELWPKKERPFTAYLLGPSGNGKTETGRALAEGVFESQDRLAIIPMGNITNVSDFDTTFGSPAQYQGGDVERQFERALRENPNGAVIVLDEISNMGGQDPHMKQALFFKLYNMLEEGKYISPRDGRVYDLTKYIFILTGNDGEENFFNMTADDLLLDTWRSIKSPEKVRDLMRRAGIPNAFINRMTVKLLMKPLLSTEVDGVAQKLWRNQIKDFMAANPGVEIVTENGFHQKLVKAFFSADQGGRAIRDVLGKNVGAIIGLSLMASGIDTSNMHGIRVVVGLEDNLTSKSYFVPSAQERNVEFTATVYENGKAIHTEKIPVTASAVRQILLTSRDARLTAFHEAGHAVANDPAVTSMKTSYITIRGGQARDLTYYGYAKVQPIGNGSGNLDHDKTIAMIARLWAGRKAQEMAGFNADTGWSQDLKQIRSIGGKYLTTWGLDRDLLGLQLDKEGNPLVGGPAAALFKERLDALIDEGEALASKLLQARWREVRAITAELLLHGEIKSERIDEIKATLAGEIPGKKVQKIDWDYFQYKARGNRCSTVFLR